MTTRHLAGGYCGLTVNAFTSVSLEPPLIAICVHIDASTLPCLRGINAFTVNILPESAEPTARTFASSVHDRFAGMAYRLGATDTPILSDACAFLECRIVGDHSGGDHRILLAQVVEGAHESVYVDPLVFFRGGYSSLAR